MIITIAHSDPEISPEDDVPHPEIVDDSTIPENWIEIDLPEEQAPDPYENGY